jgi:sugar lactone lactonase YvrE
VRRSARRASALLAFALSVAGGLVAAPVAADMLLPPGFAASLYLTGDGFGASVPGVPSASTLGFDRAGVLYLARNGRRYGGGGEEDHLLRIYRIPTGGARLNRDNERDFLYGPPLRNPQVATVRQGRELLVTTFDRDRKIGILYRVPDGRAELLAGGTPAGDAAPVFRQPEGAAVDSAGNLYVADREQGVVVKLDASGVVLDPQWVRVSRPRLLAMDAEDQLWIGADGEASAPWGPGPGEIWRVTRSGSATLVLRGPLPSAIAISPGGHLFVADRPSAQIFLLTPDGRRIDFARFPEGSAARGLAFAPVTPETRRAGIAGDLFVVTIKGGTFQVNEVVRVSGPFDEHARAH